MLWLTWKKNDRIPFFLHESNHLFNKSKCEIGSPNAGCFNLEKEFQDYASDEPWTGKRLGHLLNDVTIVNGALIEARKVKTKV